MQGLELFIFQGLNGVVWGLIFALTALGLCLSYGMMRLMNAAHGSLFMLGAVSAITFMRLFGINFWATLVLAPICISLFTILLNRLLLQKVLTRPPAIGLLATAGLLLVIDNTVLATFGSTPVSVPVPIPGVVRIFGVLYPTYRVAVAAVAVLVLLGLWAFIRFSRYGLWMRAVPQSPDLAMAVGVPIRRVNELTLALAGFMAGLAGVLVTPISGADYQMGIGILAAAFIIVVAGGPGSLIGAIVAAMILGLARGLFATNWTPPVAEMLAFLVLLPILVVKPNGLFGGKINA